MSGRVVNIFVNESEHDMRLDTLLAAQPDAPSRSACAKLVEKGDVRINGVPARSKSERVCMGDSIQAVFPEPEQKAGPLAPNPIPLDIRYEDDDLIVLSKQAGLVCHPAPGHENDTLANALVAHCGYDHLGLLQGDDRPGIVHRLDMDTTGLMLAAKNDETQQALQDLIRLRTLDRRYITLVQGYVAPDEGTVDIGIARNPKDRLKMCATDDLSARQAITTFRTLERFEAGSRDEGFSLLECHLYTGRTHQIRVHMAHIRHAVVGDPLYGHPKPQRNLGLDRQFLHSWRVDFDHPRTGERILIEDTLPHDLQEALLPLNARSMGRTEAGGSIVPKLFGAAL